MFRIGIARGRPHPPSGVPSRHGVRRRSARAGARRPRAVPGRPRVRAARLRPRSGAADADAAAAETYAVRIDDPFQTNASCCATTGRIRLPLARCGSAAARDVLDEGRPSRPLPAPRRVIAGASAERNIPSRRSAPQNATTCSVPAPPTGRGARHLRVARDASRQAAAERPMEALAAARTVPGGLPPAGAGAPSPEGGWSRVVGTPVTLREGVGVKLSHRSAPATRPRPYGR